MNIIRAFTNIKEFFKFTNNYEGELIFRDNRAFDNKGNLICEFITKKIKNA